MRRNQGTLVQKQYVLKFDVFSSFLAATVLQLRAPRSGVWGLSALLRGFIVVAVGTFVVLLILTRLRKTSSTAPRH